MTLVTCARGTARRSWFTWVREHGAAHPLSLRFADSGIMPIARAFKVARQAGSPNRPARGRIAGRPRVQTERLPT